MWYNTHWDWDRDWTSESIFARVRFIRCSPALNIWHDNNSTSESFQELLEPAYLGNKLILHLGQLGLNIFQFICCLIVPRRQRLIHFRSMQDKAEVELNKSLTQIRHVRVQSGYRNGNSGAENDDGNCHRHRDRQSQLDQFALLLGRPGIFVIR